MENALYIGLSRQVALQAQMNTIANNIANINTPGYKSQHMVFEKYLVNTDKNDQETLTMVLDYGQFTSTSQGSLKLTGNQLDIAIEGDGYMMIETSQGTMYTRAGNFSLNEDGEIVNGAGQRVLSERESPITIPRDAREIKITVNGGVVTEQGVVGQLGVVEFNNRQELEFMGNGLFKSVNDIGIPPVNSKVRQGMIEGSNVQGVLEMTNMIDVSRQYQSMHRLLQSEHDRQRNTIQKLAETQA